jgi:HAD superfamily hydrolase (TIGR01549 family)
MEYIQGAGLESDPWEHQVLYDVFEPHAREYSPTQSIEAKRRYRLRFAERVFDRLNIRGSGAVAADHAAEFWRLLGPASLALYSDVTSVLEGLKRRGLPVAVVSNWQCGLTHFCTDLGIGGMLDDVVASAEVGSAKPEPEIFHEACRLLGVSPKSTLHVGDSTVDDFEGARQAGLQAILVKRDPDRDETSPSIPGLVGVLDLLAPEA